jgi:hypothetical protein
MVRWSKKPANAKSTPFRWKMYRAYFGMLKMASRTLPGKYTFFRRNLEAVHIRNKRWSKK